MGPSTTGRDAARAGPLRSPAGRRRRAGGVGPQSCPGADLLPPRLEDQTDDQELLGSILFPVVRSAGLLVWRTRDGVREVLLAHPGGPYYAGKDDGVWSLPKGEHPPEEDPLDAARREYAEELGLPAPDGPCVPLGDVVLKSGKTVAAWAVEADPDLTGFSPGTFDLLWPPRSGRTQAFPEVDRVTWFGLPDAAVKLHPAQVPFLRRLPA